MSPKAYIALGSNLGDSASLIQKATAKLAVFSTIPPKLSSMWESAPIDCPPGSGNFINAVVRIVPSPAITPESLLESLQTLEEQFGRKPKQVLNEARPLDLDLIVFGQEIRNTPFLTLPHPRAHLRAFVLAPLAEMDPDLVLPGQQETVSALAKKLVKQQPIQRLQR